MLNRTHFNSRKQASENAYFQGNLLLQATNITKTNKYLLQWFDCNGFTTDFPNLWK